MHTTSNQIDTRATLETLRASAAAAVAKYPQYRNHFVGYKLARVKRDVVTKMGLAFKRGEYVIAVDSGSVVLCGHTVRAHVTAWSRRNNIDTSLKASDVEWIVTP